MRDLIIFLGRAVCHQLPGRSLGFGCCGPLPVCSRCTGIFLGVVVSHIYLYFFPNKSKAMPLLPVSLALVALMVPLAADGVTSYLGLRETTNLVRLATGLGLGVSLPLLYMPLFQDDPARQLPGRFGWLDLGVVVLAASALGALVYSGLISSWLFWSLLIIAGHFLVYFNVIGVVLARFGITHKAWSLLGYVLFVLALSALRSLVY